MLLNIGKSSAKMEPIGTTTSENSTKADTRATAGQAAEYLRFTLIPGISAFVEDDDGQDLIEYALVSALVALGAVAAIKTVSTKIALVFTAIGTTLTSSV